MTVDELAVTVETDAQDPDVEAMRSALREMLRDLGAEFADRFPGATLSVS